MVGSYSRCELLGGKGKDYYVMATVFDGFNRPGGGVMLIVI